MTDIAELFSPEPHQWGLRGDLYLWRDMRQRFVGVACPDSHNALYEMLAAMYETLTEHPITHDPYIYIERYSHGGMSSGGIAPAFWRETAIPLLCRRAMDQNKQ